MNLVITFNEAFALENKDIFLNFIRTNAIKSISNGSLVWMKNEDPWLDYLNVSERDLDELIKEIKTKNQDFREAVSLTIRNI